MAAGVCEGYELLARLPVERIGERQTVATGREVDTASYRVRIAVRPLPAAPVAVPKHARAVHPSHVERQALFGLHLPAGAACPVSISATHEFSQPQNTKALSNHGCEYTVYLNSIRVFAVRFNVRPLRVNGRRLPWREVQNGPAYEGDLTTYEMHGKAGRVFAAKLAGPDPVSPNQLPVLYEPVFTGMATLAFRLRGFERHEGTDGPYSVAQEWHCELANHR